MGIDAHMSFFYDLKVEGHEDKRYAKYMNSFLGRMSKEQRQAWDAAYVPKNEAFLESDLKGKDLVRWKYQRYVKDYLRCVAAVDDGVGRTWTLDKLGLSENSIVIYSSDQGFYLGEHGWYDKRWIYEESLQMPFVMRWPGKIQAGTKIQKLTQNIDFAPFFLEVAGAEVPDEIRGNATLREKGRKAITIITMRLLYATSATNWFSRTKEWILVDLEKDPLEMKSFHEDPAYKDTFDADQTEEGTLLDASP